MGLVGARCLKTARILAFALIMSCQTAFADATDAFYVSPSGSDSNAGTSPSKPFLTLDKAKTAMERSATKTTYVLGGMFSLSAPITLNGPQDDGEAWLGFPGQLPVLDGGNTTAAAFTISNNSGPTTGITIRHLTMQRFVSGIEAQASSGDLFDSNTFFDILSPDTNHAAIYTHANFSDSTISHNVINRNTGPGIIVASGGTSEVNSNVQISDNAVYNTNTDLTDTGAIYILDRGHRSTGQVISGNIIGNYGATGPATNTKGIYIDDEASHVTVVKNTIYGTGQYGLEIHGGNDVVFEKNIFDLSGAQALALYQDDVGAGFPNYGMGGNIFKNNLVYSSGRVTRLWDYLNESGGTIAKPANSKNSYWPPGYSSANLRSPIVDSSPSFSAKIGTTPFVFGSPTR